MFRVGFFSLVSVAVLYAEMTQQCKDYFPNSPLVTAIKKNESANADSTNCKPSQSNKATCGVGGCWSKNYGKDGGWCFSSLKVSTLTLGQIKKYQSDGTLNAVGSAQFIKGTFNDMSSGYDDNTIFSAQFQESLWWDYFFKKKSNVSAARKFLLCDGATEENAALGLAREWASISIGQGVTGNYGKTNTTGGLMSYYEGGKGNNKAHTSYKTITDALKATKNDLIKMGCTSPDCQLEDENATTPENSNSSPQFDYTHTDKTFQSSKRQLKAQYKYENANNLLAA